MSEQLVTVHFAGITHIDMTYGLAVQQMQKHIDKTDAEIAALTERLRITEAERDEWKRKYETQCAGSMSAHERRIHLEAELRAELQRKDAALKTCEQALFDHVAIEGDQASTALKAVRAALQPKDKPCQS